MANIKFLINDEVIEPVEPPKIIRIRIKRTDSGIIQIVTDNRSLLAQITPEGDFIPNAAGCRGAGLTPKFIMGQLG